MSGDFENELSEKTSAINELLKEKLPERGGYADTVFSAMNYSLTAPGKRMRPLLIQETAEFFGGASRDVTEPFMAAIEMIHTYSLIHDDLPAIDNDDYRRGRLTCHKVYGEAMGILAGDALLNYAYETAAQAFDGASDAEEFRRVAGAVKILASKPGVNGMLGGQVVDVEMTGRDIPADMLEFIFEKKTGALIEASMMIGACLAGASDEETELVQEAGRNIGMAFQIQDDILDVTGDEAALGKPLHSDEKNKKTTWVTLYGMDKAAEDVSEYLHKAMEILGKVKGREYFEESFLYSYILWLMDRKY